MFDGMTQQPNVRSSQRQNRNASSFNIISFDPNTGNQGDVDRQLKKDRQNAYRDQLDQMKTIKQATPPLDSYNRNAAVRNPSRDQPSSWVGDNGYQGNQYEQREQVPSYNDYKLDQHATEIQKNYNLAGGPTGGYSEYQQEQQRNANRYVTELPGVNTFEAQDQQRNQLLDKIRSGYNNQNYGVYNAYQKAHEDRESSRQDFERNVIEKAAREKLIKEQEAAVKDWDRKKRLQQEMSESNRRAIDAKSSQKRREKEKEDFHDQQRNQDALAAHQRGEYLQREKMRRMQEETNQSLSRQIQDQGVQKQAHGKEISPSKYKIGWDSIDNLTNSRVQDSQSLRGSQLGNQDAYRGAAQYEDPSYGQQGGYQEDYARGGYEQAPSANRNQGYGQQQQQGGSSNDYTRIKEKNRNGSGFNIISNEYR